MAQIPIILIPDPVLRKVAAPVTEITDGTRRLLDDMAETMYDAPGIGLAAPQVNILERVIVMDCGRDEAPELYKMINPEIVARSDDRSVLKRAACRFRTRPPRWSARQASMCAISIPTAKNRCCIARGCWRPVSSTRSIIWTGCFSSIICRG